MYAVERKRIIREYLKEHNQAQVQELGKLLNVSEVTVRRDLERLETEGLLTRTHGGAVLNKEDVDDPLLEVIERSGAKEDYDRIASIALRLVSDGDVVMLSNGPVNTRIAAALAKRSGLTVLTNDMSVALRVSVQEHNQVVLLGGELDKSELALFGTMALSNLNKFYVNHLFIEVDGINEDLHVTVNSQGKADLIHGALDVAKETTLICPVENFDRSAFFRLGHIRLFKRVISNHTIRDYYKEKIFQHDIALFTTIEAFEGSE